MAQTRKKEQHVAVFGESGSGKTVLISSFFGSTVESEHSRKGPFKVVADHVGQGQQLLQNYYRMRRSAEVPLANRFRAIPYRFSVVLKDAANATSRKSRPFDALQIVWHDYPGEWFEQDVSGAEEARRRVDTFRSLLVSDVAILLVDGQKLLDNTGDEERYLKSLFSNFSNGLLTLRDDLLKDGKPLVIFPRIWIIALSKADLLPDMTVSNLRALVIEKAAGNLADLRETLASLVQDDDALSVGEDFVILSSAKFKSQVIDVEERIGVDLILPLASVLPLERHVRWAHKRDTSGRVAQQLLGKAETLGASSLAYALMGVKLVSLPGPLGVVARVVSSFASKEVLTNAVNLAGEKLREANEEAVAKGQVLTAILTQFKIDLEQGEENDVLRRSQR